MQRQFYEGLVLLIISAVAMLGALQIPTASSGETWAGIVPFSAALLLSVISLVFLVMGVYQPKLKAITTSASVDSSKDDTEASASSSLHVIVLFVLAVLYQQSFGLFGYLLPTAIVAPIVLYLFGTRRPLSLLVGALLCPAVFYLIFFVLLGVFPPYGEVFDILNLLQGQS